MHPSLDSDKIIAQIETLTRRIDERFPESGLSSVSRMLLEVGRQARQRAESIARRNVPLLLSALVLCTVLVAAILWAVVSLIQALKTSTLPDLVVITEPTVNVVIVLGAGMVFIVTWGVRIRRRRAMKAIHELRSIAHIIDMHQLTKDPEWVLKRGEVTLSTPRLEMSAFELSRYLDFCSELLSLTGKLAALYAQHFDDPAVVDAVGELELLTTGLSRKVWQKLMILHTLRAE